MLDAPNTELTLLDNHPTQGDMADEILEGLSKPLKTVPPKYFYDKRGSELFDDITELDEYYPTVTEIGIMRDNVDAMADLIGPCASLIEFGSGSSAKTGRLLDAMHEPAAYVPVEISKDHCLICQCPKSCPNATSCISRAQQLVIFIRRRHTIY